MSSNFISEKYWEESGNRRRFFDDFAVAKGFDSLIPDSWYNIARDDLIEHVYTLLPSFLCLSPPSSLPYSSPFSLASSLTSTKQGGQSVLHYYSDSAVKALLDLYPSIGIDPSKFTNVASMFEGEREKKKGDGGRERVRGEGGRRGGVNQNISGKSWHATNIRMYFDQFAARHSFDPLVAGNWYSIPNHLIFEDKVLSFLLSLLCSLAFPSCLLYHQAYELYREVSLPLLTLEGTC